MSQQATHPHWTLTNTLGMWVVKAGRRIIASFDTPYEKEARLIAAAPDLLAALELAVSKDMLSGVTHTAAVTAIAKAKGVAA